MSKVFVWQWRQLRKFGAILYKGCHFLGYVETKIAPFKAKEARYAHQGPIYMKREQLEQAEYLEDALQL